MAPARHTQEEADTSPPILLVVGARPARAAPTTVVAVVDDSRRIVRQLPWEMFPCQLFIATVGIQEGRSRDSSGDV